MQEQDLSPDEIDVTELVKRSPTLARLVEEVRLEGLSGNQAYNRMHNRSGGRRPSLPPSPPPDDPPEPAPDQEGHGNQS